MRENDETTTVEGAQVPAAVRPEEEGVALSPYDSDLQPATAEVEPEPYTLENSPGYEPAGHTAVLPAGTAAQGELPASPAPVPATAPAPAWQAAPVEQAAWQAAPAPPSSQSGVAPGVVAGAAGAAVAAGAAGAAADRSDAGVHRTRIMQAHTESNEPRRLMTEPEADARAERYAPEVPAEVVAGTEYEKVPSRAGAHWWAILSTLLLGPFAWYLLADAGARMTLPAGSQWETGAVNLAAVAELVGGLVVLGVILWAARASSLGAFIVGGLLVVAGGAFVVAPAWVQDLLAPYLENLRDFNDMGGNIAHHLVADGSTGRLLIAGFTLVMIGFISHGARRRGRTEQKIREAVERRRAAGL